MPTQKQDPQNDTEDMNREDEALPQASEDQVLEETARMAREGRKALDADPREPKPASE